MTQPKQQSLDPDAVFNHEPPARLIGEAVQIWHDFTSTIPTLTIVQTTVIFMAVTLVAKLRQDPERFRASDYGQLSKLLSKVDVIRYNSRFDAGLESSEWQP